jgi:hypothetical protein
MVNSILWGGDIEFFFLLANLFYEGGLYIELMFVFLGKLSSENESVEIALEFNFWNLFFDMCLCSSFFSCCACVLFFSSENQCWDGKCCCAPRQNGTQKHTKTVYIYMLHIIYIYILHM